MMPYFSALNRRIAQGFLRSLKVSVLFLESLPIQPCRKPSQESLIEWRRRWDSAISPLLLCAQLDQPSSESLGYESEAP